MWVLSIDYRFSELYEGVWVEQIIREEDLVYSGASWKFVQDMVNCWLCDSLF